MCLYAISHLIIFLIPDITIKTPDILTIIFLGIALALLGTAYSGFLASIMGSIPCVVD